MLLNVLQNVVYWYRKALHPSVSGAEAEKPCPGVRSSGARSWEEKYSLVGGEKFRELRCLGVGGTISLCIAISST